MLPEMIPAVILCVAIVVAILAIACLPIAAERHRREAQLRPGLVESHGETRPPARREPTKDGSWDAMLAWEISRPGEPSIRIPATPTAPPTWTGIDD